VQREHLSGLLAELARLGEARQAFLSEQTYAIYADELSAYELRDVRTALRALAREPKDRYETAFPRLDTLLQRVGQARDNRMFPPTPVRQFVPCGKCFPGGLVFVDVNGEPCDESESPNRTMGRCACYRAWEAEKRQAEARGADGGRDV
jgi:hypothetical protein